MRLPSALRLSAVALLLLSVLGLLAGTARAELIWSAETGWRVEGGALSGLAGAEGRNALDQMNNARRDEESGSWRGAIKVYQSIAKKYPHSLYAPEAQAPHREAEWRPHNVRFGHLGVGPRPGARPGDGPHLAPDARNPNYDATDLSFLGELPHIQASTLGGCHMGG